MSKKALIISLAALGLIIVLGIILLSFCRHTSSERPEDCYAGNVPTVHSAVDRDGDGIDDQADILAGALAYVATEPQYKSKYYEGGYPDDGYGVCTDVVAQALLAAGYDLQQLVDEDIQKRPAAYDIAEPDSNIDFRRVSNLKVFFAACAIELTNDISAVEQWQGGDIVIFEKHIGIISDRRNAEGIPYVIHHNSSKQRSYEQDILASRKDIAAHYRFTQ